MEDKINNSGIKELTVGQAIDYLNSLIKPQEVLVRGEIGEKISTYPYGSYFDLLDKKEEAVLHCLVWRPVLETSNIELKKGKEVLILGHPEIYKRTGGIKLIAENISVVGEGELKKAFEALKKKLKEEGFFAPEAKRQITRFPERIGLITSRYGRGALPDFQKHLAACGIKVYFYDVRVEGLVAIKEISSAILWFNRNMPDLDAIALIRGGGSYESLQPFNSEEVAKSIFSSKIPVICGVGHEKDETIADYVADIRASTPTDAAKILSRGWELALASIYDLEKNITSLNKKLIKEFKLRMAELGANLLRRMEGAVKERREENMQKLKELVESSRDWLRRIKENLHQQEKVLAPSNPKLKLKQGYTLTLNSKGKIIKEPKVLRTGEMIKTKFYKGQIISEVKQKNGRKI